MPTFTLEMLPANKGDCLILHYGEGAVPDLIVIDGGPSNTWHPHLRPRLEELRDARGLADHQGLFLEMLMVSHVDDDHIKGLLEMADELRVAADASQPQRYEVGTLWHNSFDDIVGNSELATASESMTASAGGDLAAAGLGHDETLILASVNQGRQLRIDAEFLDWPVNTPADGLLSVGDHSRDPIEFFAPLKMTLVGPRKSEVERLQKKHDKFLEEKGLARSDSGAALAAFTDRSAANLASIVVLVEMADKRMLLTGDARGDKVLKGLEEQGPIDRGGTLEVDLLKVPHHGSDRNVTEGFFEQIHARHYLFSGDGEHGNPERACLEMLFDARPEGGYELWFTYPLATIDAKRAEECHHSWDPDLHGLAELIARETANGLDITVHDGEGPKPVDLLDPLT